MRPASGPAMRAVPRAGGRMRARPVVGGLGMGGAMASMPAAQPAGGDLMSRMRNDASQFAQAGRDMGMVPYQGSMSGGAAVQPMAQALPRPDANVMTPQAMPDPGVDQLAFQQAQSF